MALGSKMYKETDQESGREGAALEVVANTNTKSKL
jgi:hypothetical protein